MVPPAATIHASAVLLGRRAVLIRGPSGSGKSRLALELIDLVRSGSLAFARLVADDRVLIEARYGRLIARPPEALAGLIEVRGVGLMRLAHEASAVVGLIVDLAAPDAQRLPEPVAQTTEIEGLLLPRLAVASTDAALPAVRAYMVHEMTGAAN